MNTSLVAIWVKPPRTQGNDRNGGPMVSLRRPRPHSNIVEEFALPRVVTVDTLCETFSARLGQPIDRVLVPMPPELPIGWTAVRRSGLSIVIDAAAPRSVRDMALCHELGHLGLGHHLQHLNDPTAIRRLLPTLEPSAVLATLAEPIEGMLARTCFEEESERDAEELGTALFGLLNPWNAEAQWDVPSQAAGVITQIERALGGRV